MKTEERRRIVELLEFLLLDVGLEVFEDVFDLALDNEWLRKCDGCGSILMPEEVIESDEACECKDCINWRKNEESDRQAWNAK